MGTNVQDVAARAKELIAERKYQDAVRACRRILLLRPDEAPARLLLAQALLALGRHDEVRLEMQALTRKDPGCVSAYRLLAEAHIRGGNKDAALRALEEALRLEPGDSEARELMEELDELEGPPPMETIERWFGNVEPATVEVVGDPLGAVPTRAELPPVRGELAPTATVRTDPHFVSEPSTKPQVPRRKRTILGMPAVAQPGREPTPAREPAPLPDDGTESLDSLELLETGTVELETGELRSVPGPAEEGPAGDVQAASGGTRELSVEDLALEEFEPLEGEATHAIDMAPAGCDAKTRGRAIVPGGSDQNLSEPLDGETTRARPRRPGASVSEELADLDDARTTEARPRRPSLGVPSVAGPPSSAPLEGEPTQARAPAPVAAAGSRTGVPAGFASGAVPGAAPWNPLQSSVSRPSPSPVSPAAVSTPVIAPREPRASSSRAKRRLPSWADPRGWLAPLRGLRGPALVAVAGVPVLLVVALVAGIHLYLASRAEERIAEATRAASMSGAIADLRQALALDAEEDSQASLAVARRARLRAIVMLDHGLADAAAAREERARIHQLLESIEAGERAGLVDALAAHVFLSLSEGRPDQAVAQAERVPPTDGAEGAYAAARAALTVGDVDRAEEVAGRLSASLRVGPRYGALVARVLLAHGRVDGSLAVLDRVAGVEGSPVALLARAEVHRVRHDAEAMFADAQRVFEQVGDDSPRQRAWAQLLLAEARLMVGESGAARDLAMGIGPLEGDEAFGLRLVDLLRQVGSLDRAAAVLEALPEVPARPPERALVAAEVFLARNELPRAEAVLGTAETSPRTSYLQGRVAEAKGEREAAVAHYEAAAADPVQFVRAKTALGLLALGGGDVEDAIAHLSAARERDPSNPSVVAALVRALLARGAVDEARAAVDEALARRADDPDLLLAKARVELARGQPAAALAILEGLVEQRGDDAALHALRGEAARLSGDRDKAQEAFERALGLDPRQPRALMGRVELALAAYDVEGANAALAAAREGGVESNTLRLLEGRLLVMQGAGKPAAALLRPLVRRRRGRRRRSSSDPVVWATYGRALAQAEDDRGALRALQRALDLDGDQVDAHLALAAVRTRRGDLAGASRAIGEARQLVESASLGPAYEARVLAATGRLRYESGNLGEAEELATQALAKDPQSAPAHLLMALVKDAQGQDPVPHLRQALEGHFVTPEVLGQLVVFDRRAADRCALARRYLEAAPRGLDARDARSLVRRCR